MCQVTQSGDVKCVGMLMGEIMLLGDGMLMGEIMLLGDGMLMGE